MANMAHGLIGQLAMRHVTGVHASELGHVIILHQSTVGRTAKDLHMKLENAIRMHALVCCPFCFYASNTKFQASESPEGWLLEKRAHS